MATLEIKIYMYRSKTKKFLKGVNLSINTGEIHAVMGPNGTGKSTLSAAIMGHPSYEVTEGENSIRRRKRLRNGSRRTCSCRSIFSDAISK